MKYLHAVVGPRVGCLEPNAIAIPDGIGDEELAALAAQPCPVEWDLVEDEQNRLCGAWRTLVIPNGMALYMNRAPAG